MTDHTVGRINHSGHDHPNTAHAKKKCRAEMLAAAHAAKPKRGRPRKADSSGFRLDTMAQDTAPARKRVAAKAGKRPRREVEAQAAVVDGLLAKEAESSVALDKGDGSTFAVDVDGDAKARVTRRNKSGKFTRETLHGWSMLLDHLDGAQDFLNEQGADLIEARLTTTLGGETFVATFDGLNWSVEVQ